MTKRRLMKVHALGVGVALALATLPSLAATPQDPRIEQLRVRALVATTCLQCHGTDGRAVPGTAMVSLAGMDRNHLRVSLLAFRDGTRQGTVMNQLMRGFTPEQIDAISTYFAQLRP